MSVLETVDCICLSSVNYLSHHLLVQTYGFVVIIIIIIIIITIIIIVIITIIIMLFNEGTQLTKVVFRGALKNMYMYTAYVWFNFILHPLIIFLVFLLIII